MKLASYGVECKSGVSQRTYSVNVASAITNRNSPAPIPRKEQYHFVTESETADRTKCVFAKGICISTKGDIIDSMLAMMKKTKIKLASPAAHFGATKIPVFEEVFSGRVILVGYITHKHRETRKAA